MGGESPGFEGGRLQRRRGLPLRDGNRRYPVGGAATGAYEDLVKAGVIDPTKVTRTALVNAASVAALMLTTEATIVERPTGEAEAPDLGIRSHPRI